MTTIISADLVDRKLDIGNDNKANTVAFNKCLDE